MAISEPLLVVGGGNMGGAIVAGGIARGVLDPARVAIAEPDRARQGSFAAMGCRVADSGSELAEWLVGAESGPGLGQVLLAVKPQAVEPAAASVSSLFSGPRRTAMTILAGTPTSRVRALLGPSAAVVRLMPNTPARVGRGATAIALGDGAARGDDAVARALFGAVGRVFEIDESLMDAFTALVGSGPAYVFYLAEAMAAAGVEMGFGPALAAELARATVAGAGAMLDALPDTPDALRRAVTSPGGTTAAAIEALDSRDVPRHVRAAIHAAARRAAELSGR